MGNFYKPLYLREAKYRELVPVSTASAAAAAATEDEYAKAVKQELAQPLSNGKKNGITNDDRNLEKPVAIKAINIQPLHAEPPHTNELNRSLSGM